MPPLLIADFLSRTPLFREVPVELLGKLAPYIEVQAYPAGAPIVPAGRVVATLNVLYAGGASLRSIDGGLLVGDLGPGDTLGEVEFALGQAGSLTVIADAACEVLVIQRVHFDRLVQTVPSVQRAFAQQLAARFVRLAELGGAGPVEAAPVPGTSPALAADALRFVEIGQFEITQQVLDLVPSRLIIEHRLIPLELRNRTVLIGMVTPRSHIARMELGRALQGLEPEYVAVGADDFAQALVRYKLDMRERVGQGTASKLPKPVYQVEVKKEADKLVQMIGDDAVQMLDRILAEAVERGVSDVHIEPEANAVRVRFRQQGLLQDRKSSPIPASLATTLVGRIKVLAELDITERRAPQDGRLVVRFGSRELSIRVSTMPVSRGEKVVLRILDPVDIMRPMEQIFLDARQQDLVGKAVSAAWGAIVVFGATGSGKTSTLYSLVNYRRKIRPDHSIVTIEDPVEYVMQGITQTGVNSKAGLEYSTALRALLRQDPDAIMIGEVRDHDTAAVLTEAATTGHLLLASAHASNLMAAFERFQSLGISRARFTQVAELLVVQRLVRRLCPSCTREEDVPRPVHDSLVRRGLVPPGAGPRLPKAGGCDACQDTGYRGRLVVAEVLAVNERVRAALAADLPSEAFHKALHATGQYVTRAECARQLLAKRMITPLDAVAASE